MASKEKARSIQKTARIAGVLYFLQIPLGVFGNLYISRGIVVPGNMSATVSNILAHEFLFRLSMVSAIVCALVTIATAFCIYKVLKSVNKTYAMLIILFTVLATPIVMINELNHVGMLYIAKNPSQLSLMPLFLTMYHYGIQIVGIFWGLWLLPMGYLVFKSKFTPKVIGILLMIGCLSYLVDFVAFFVFPQFGIVTTGYTFLGEVLMVLWLLIKGINVKEFEKSY